MGRQTINVAMCTYNGERYLAEQLASIAAQTVLPERLVVVDDQSSDGTVDIVRTFTADAPFPVELHVNECNLGYVKNFEKAIGLCGGEIIVLSDQDDVWLPEKLQRLSAALDATGADLVFSDADLVDADLRPLHLRLWDTLGFTAAQQAQVLAGQAYRVLARHYVVTGATMAFRSVVRGTVLPIPPVWFHDGWIALLLAAAGSITLVPEPLIRYRQHGNNQIGASRKTMGDRLTQARTQGRKFYQDEVARYEIAATRLREMPSPPEEFLALLAAKIEHLRARAGLPGNRLSRVRPVLRELAAGRYREFSNGWASAARDVLI